MTREAERRVAAVTASGGDAFTAEQRRAIDRREGSLFLNAGAGSGKTRVLVERFVRAIVDDGVAVDRILAITFTEKAAGELRTRIRRRLLDLGQYERAREAEGAWVSTIHGFCARLLRAHPLDAGIDPEFRVLTEPDSRRIAVEAFDRALADFMQAAAADGALDLVASYTPDKLERMVRTVHGRLRTDGAARPSLPPLQEPVAGDSRGRLERAAAAAAAALAGAGSGQAVNAAALKLAGLAEALTRLPDGTPGDADVFAPFEVKRGNAKALRGAVFDQLAQAHAAWLGECAAHKAHADYVLLARLLALYGGHFERLKTARSALDFDDLELMARDLLHGNRALRADLCGRFEQVMVDEFQDTNPLQNQLLELISRANLFTVGDEFQSIYGFRGADVDVFRRRREVAAGAGEEERLAHSFRSHPNVLAAINAAFAPVFGDSYVPLVAGRPVREPDPAPRVDLLVCDRSKSRWDERVGEVGFGESMRKVTPWRAAEARLLARRVDELARGGSYAPGDIAVLVRAARDIDVYERALAERGLPTYSLAGSGYWAREEVGDLRAWLASLANPQDELSLYNVLASPFVGASLDSLALIRVHARALGRDIWWALEEAFADGGDGSGGLAAAIPDAEAVGAFVRRFATERRAAARMSIELLIDRAVTASGYDVRALRTPGGERRLANVRKLMRLAREFEAESGRDVRGFIDLVDEQELLAVREGEAPLEGEGLDAIRLMTVHAAKGLEFPVVCVADLGRDARSDNGPLQVSPDGRVGLEVASLAGRRDAALAMETIRQEQERLQEGEERRIFYVALTRAQEHLIVSGATDTLSWPEPKPLGAPIEWLWPALAPGAKLIFERAASGTDERLGDGVRVRCVLLSPETLDEVLPAADREPAAAGFAAQPVADAPGDPRPELATPAGGVPLPIARLSYSGLESYKRCGYRFYLERVVRMRRREPLAGADEPHAAPPPPEGQLALTTPAPPPDPGLTPLERGRIVHELLERLDFRRPLPPTPSAIRERARLHGLELTADGEADVAGLIDAFLASETCALIAGSARVRAELPFAFALEPAGRGGQALLINGVLDVHAENAAATLIVDYKTDAVGDGDLAALCAEKYATQRLVYALAALRAGSAAVEVRYLFLGAPGRPVSETFRSADEQALEAALLELSAGLIAGRFEPAHEPHRELCLGCPAQPALCTWGPDRTLRELRSWDREEAA